MLYLDLLKDAINRSEKILVGLGESVNNVSKEQFIKFKEFLKNKDYFVIYIPEVNEYINEVFDEYKLSKAVAEYDKESAIRDENMSDVNRYMKWLTMTVNKPLVIMEIGASFANPQILRWPLERIAYINDKSKFVRVNGTLPQVTAEIADKSMPVLMKPEEFFDTL